MIDTCRFRLYPSVFCPVFPVGWSVKTGTKVEEGRAVAYTQCQHDESALRVYGYDGAVSTIEVSLPRLYHGCNGHLLRPHEVNIAYQAALKLASEVVERVLCEKLLRLDLVHHFKGRAHDYVASLRGLKHKRVRNRQVEFFESGLEWPGKDLRIRLYDKKEELCSMPGDVQRLETQLRNEMLHGKNIPTLWSAAGFDLANCYQVYRDVCSGFASRKVPVLGTVDDLLHWLKLNKVTVAGICPVERFLSYKSRASRYRLEKALNDVSLTFVEANFLAALPASISDLTFLDCLPEAECAAPLSAKAEGGAHPHLRVA
jgi:hypothetical protein